jgi:hypothetical protein
MPLIATRGAASAQGFGEFAQSSVNYIEDVFSTWLYQGTGTVAGSTQTITNNIDLSGKGGMVWIKDRGIKDHFLFDTNRGIWKYLRSNTTDAEPGVNEDALSAFNSNGFTLTGDNNVNQNFATNNPQGNYASWTFRDQAKFFDVVTWSGNSTAGRTIPHNLGSVPGCIIVKCTSNITDWAVYHRSLSSAANALQLNTTGAQITQTGYWNSTAPTSSVFTVGADNDVNATGRTYVAYLFAHDAGGFGAAGTDNVISCGSYTGNSSSQSINIGYEPQWILVKNITNTSDWQILDVMRGMSYTSFSALYANLSNAEITGTSYRFEPTATGWNFPSAGAATYNTTGNTYIYIAIRRGPMRTPTSGTSVFTPATRTGTNTVGEIISNAGFPVDLIIGRNRALANDAFIDRLRGIVFLRSDNTDAEASATSYISSLATQAGWINSTGGSGSWNTSPNNYIQWYFRRAPGFFDVVCYTGNGVAGRTVSHNLGVTPEMIIIKKRNSVDGWFVCNANYTNKNTYYQRLNTTAAQADYGGNLVYNWGSTTFALDSANVNDNTNTYVAYLFATVAGVSKVGSYTGTGALQTINCGFASGARFVLIKRTDSTGDWWTYDSARGITSGNDPYLFLNSTAAEVTNTNYVDTASTGFQVTAAAPAGLNANGGTYIFLAIA